MTKGISIVGIGGTTSPSSSTENAMKIALQSAESAGASVTHFDGAFLSALPHYSYGALESSPEARELVAKIREADGIILATPSYHGSISGLMKNAIDYFEETSKDSRVYMDGVPVGIVVTAYGWQAIGSTLGSMRSIVHALRGWPTPFGAGIRAVPGMFKEGKVDDENVQMQLNLVGKQVYDFAKLHCIPTSV
ncbi:NAD(P)H-dependent oxidoreductase [Aliiglaciecola sp. 3_MG-2023]|uniref:NADPH-dependent FMN reductase n=1 Tax=Aliiglaciecola sp. 3_MG-2023 TaxID=3062644 RepID=UPI0026E2BFB8|nr:NAD(P)H-dependent oxidoreductase [Aliiglaciecola sp. 3_MG-2023]MDO6693109.1 NAD(P)H-dependent oxidoreductase [Aliiglaciecola sp. 3_MG-2023]